VGDAFKTSVKSVSTADEIETKLPLLWWRQDVYFTGELKKHKMCSLLGIETFRQEWKR